MYMLKNRPKDLERYIKLHFGLPYKNMGTVYIQHIWNRYFGKILTIVYNFYSWVFFNFQNYHKNIDLQQNKIISVRAIVAYEIFNVASIPGKFESTSNYFYETGFFTWLSMYD
jgi:hypothetical protein